MRGRLHHRAEQLLAFVLLSRLHLIADLLRRLVEAVVVSLHRADNALKTRVPRGELRQPLAEVACGRIVVSVERFAGENQAGHLGFHRMVIGAESLKLRQQRAGIDDVDLIQRTRELENLVVGGHPLRQEFEELVPRLHLFGGVRQSLIEGARLPVSVSCLGHPVVLLLTNLQGVFRVQQGTDAPDERLQLHLHLQDRLNAGQTDGADLMNGDLALDGAVIGHATQDQGRRRHADERQNQFRSQSHPLEHVRFSAKYRLVPHRFRCSLPRLLRRPCARRRETASLRPDMGRRPRSAWPPVGFYPMPSIGSPASTRSMSSRILTRSPTLPMPRMKSVLTDAPKRGVSSMLRAAMSRTS